MESYFNLLSEYSSSIILTDIDLIFTDRTSATAVKFDMSFRITYVSSQLQGEYKNIEFLWKQRQGLGEVAALPSATSQIPGIYLCFLVTTAMEKQDVDTEANKRNLFGY